MEELSVEARRVKVRFLEETPSLEFWETSGAVNPTRKLARFDPSAGHMADKWTNVPYDEIPELSPEEIKTLNELSWRKQVTDQRRVNKDRKKK